MVKHTRDELAGLDLEEIGVRFGPVVALDQALVRLVGTALRPLARRCDGLGRRIGRLHRSGRAAAWR